MHGTGKLIKKIRRREIYSYIGEVKIPKSGNTQKIMSELQELCEGTDVRAEDLLLRPSTINYGAGSSNPVDRVTFYSWRGATEEGLLVGQLRREQVSSLLPQSFEENTIRLFCKDKAKVKGAESVWKRWCERSSIKLQHTLLTPHKPKRLRPPPIPSRQQASGSETNSGGLLGDYGPRDGKRAKIEDT